MKSCSGVQALEAPAEKNCKYIYVESQKVQKLTQKAA